MSGHVVEFVKKTMELGWNIVKSNKLSLMDEIVKLYEYKLDLVERSPPP